MHHQQTNEISHITPYGPLPQNVYTLEVPNQCVGLIIGIKGQNLQAITKRSGVQKIQIGTVTAPESNTRNIFVSGSYDAVENVRKQFNSIVNAHRNMVDIVKSNEKHTIDIEVSIRFIGFIIGKGGQTIKGINQKSGAFVFISQQKPLDKDKMIVSISGPINSCTIAKQEIERIVNYLQNVTNNKTTDQTTIISPITQIQNKISSMTIPKQQKIE